ncbi:MAG: phosphoribosylglycinamide formyltransferase [Planctomycetes bacterium]|nr:phosphoribosylglycinamide formyltransferase [Planctomycetota bacterium]
MSNQLKLAVLISGNGTTLANLIHWRDQGRLMGDIKLVISSRPGVPGLSVATEAGIRTEVINAGDFSRSAREGEVIRDWKAMSKEMDKLLLSDNYDLVCMAGFLSRYIYAKELTGKILNIHPSLVPMFCGQYMYGHRVHEAVIKSGVKVSGCTVHFADRNYDSGPIILQRCCPVYSGDTVNDVAARVFEQECWAYPTAINLIGEGRVHLIGSSGIHIDEDRHIERYTWYGD